MQKLNIYKYEINNQSIIKRIQTNTKHEIISNSMIKGTDKGNSRDG